MQPKSTSQPRGGSWCTLSTSSFAGRFMLLVCFGLGFMSALFMKGEWSIEMRNGLRTGGSTISVDHSSLPPRPSPNDNDDDSTGSINQPLEQPSATPPPAPQQPRPPTGGFVTPIMTPPPTPVPTAATPWPTPMPVNPQPMTGPDYTDLRVKFQTGKDNMVNHFRFMYGSYYNELFHQRNTISRQIFSSTSKSYQRLKERFQKKILQSLVNRNDPQAPKTRLVIVYGGHSAAAGHGNLYNETKAQYIQRALQPLIDSLGMELEVRNRAMGATKSFPEISFCAESIFGNDVDLLTWEYGMTDGNGQAWVYRPAMYFARAALLDSFPVMMSTDPMSSKIHDDLVNEYEEHGLSIFNMDQQSFKALVEGFPDMFGMSQERINSLPPYVRYFRCEGKVENGEPGCADAKYSKGVCDDRKGKASWHPGYRYQALVGNTIATFLSQVLEDVVIELERVKPNPHEQLALLQRNLDEDRELFRRHSHESFIIDLLKEEAFKDDPRTKDDLLKLARGMFKSEGFCHTARLTSQIRYSGVLTESSLTGDERGGYDEGFSFETWSPDQNADIFPLIFDPAVREQCSVVLAPDYRDFFFTSGMDPNGRHLVLPNSRELEAYSFRAESANLVICLAVCEWGKCPPGQVDLQKGFNDVSQSRLTVNGVQATEALTFSAYTNCAYMKHSGGYNWAANANQQFDIRIHETSPDVHWRISSIILLKAADP